MKIAIPVWEDKVSPVLDTASRLLIVEFEDQQEATRFETYLDEQDLSRRCVRIRRLGVDTLICGAISRGFSKILEGSGIHIVPGISGHPEDVLNAYLRGDLFSSKFFMPGYQRNESMQSKEPLKSKGPSSNKRVKQQIGDEKEGSAKQEDKE
jgi:predicted Fe-Mo cluster-binding NifX family protein